MNAKRKTRKHAESKSNLFDAGALEELSRLFHETRQTLGPQQVDADWMSDPLDEWLVNLDSGETVLDRDTMAAFAVGMNETLSIRDALILSLIIDEQRCPKTQLMEFAARPHSKRNKRRMGELLTVAFEDEGIVPDKERCHAGIAMLLDIADAAPVPYCVQPLAVAAYTLWWLGDSRAVTMALQCLLLDEECSLAAMVFSAAQRGVAPAWCSG